MSTTKQLGKSHVDRLEKIEEPMLCLVEVLESICFLRSRWMKSKENSVE